MLYIVQTFLPNTYKILHPSCDAHIQYYIFFTGSFCTEKNFIQQGHIRRRAEGVGGGGGGGVGGA